MNRRIFILTTEAPELPGGQERFIQELVKVLEERGYRTQVFHWRNCAPGWLQRSRGWLAGHLSGVLAGYFTGRAANRQWSPDVIAVISNSTVGWYPFRASEKVKRFHVYHGTYRGQAEAIRPLISRLGYWKLKWWDSMVLERLSGRGKVCLVNATQIQEEVRRFFGWTASTVWLPLDTNHFRPIEPESARRTLGLERDAPVGLFVGGAQPTKGFLLVYNLVLQLPQVRWLLALRGPVPEGIAGHPNVRVYPNAASSELPLLYNAADFLVSASRYESFGYVVAEALACGTPTVATPGGASQTFLSRPPFDRFLISDPEDSAAFASAIEEILCRPGTVRLQIIEQIRPRVVELLAPENWARRFFELTGL